MCCLFDSSRNTVYECARKCRAKNKLTIRSEVFTWDTYCNDLVSISLPHGCTRIDPWTFTSCIALTSISLPPGLKTIDKQAFTNCSALTSVTLPSGLITIGEYAFSGCTGLKSLKLPHSLMNVGDGAFVWCNALTSVVFRPPVSSVFMIWAVGKSRNRSNWQITTLKHSRNLLRLITEFAWECRDVRTSMGPPELLYRIFGDFTMRHVRASLDRAHVLFQIFGDSVPVKVACYRRELLM